MQDGFFQKVVLAMIAGALLAGLVEFYKNFITGADNALNGSHPHVQMHPPPAKP